MHQAGQRGCKAFRKVSSLHYRQAKGCPEKLLVGKNFAFRPNLGKQKVFASLHGGSYRCGKEWGSELVHVRTLHSREPDELVSKYYLAYNSR